MLQNINPRFQIFEPLEPSEYSSFLHYNIGACAMARAAAGIAISEDEASTAEEAFRLSREHWDSQTQNTSFRVPPRILNRCMALYLKSSPSHAPVAHEIVSEEDLRKTWAIITLFERDYVDGCLPWPSTLFYIAKADYYIRASNIGEGTPVSQSCQADLCDASLQNQNLRRVAPVDPGKSEKATKGRGRGRRKGPPSPVSLFRFFALSPIYVDRQLRRLLRVAKRIRKSARRSTQVTKTQLIK